MQEQMSANMEKRELILLIFL